MIATAALIWALVGFEETPLSIAQRVAAKERQAFVAKDWRAFERLTTSDFVSIGTTGQRIGKKEAILRERSIFDRIVAIKDIDSTVLSVRRAEGGVLVERRSTLVAAFRSKGKQPFPATLRQQTESLLVPQGHDWLLKRTRILSYRWMPGERRTLV